MQPAKARVGRRRSTSWEHISAVAIDLFTERGFADASVADVVERAGSSVGSLYHHFGGKAELFLALWEDHQAAQEEAASAAVAALREAGEDDPLELFIAGAQAFLDDSWQRRDLVRLLMDGDGPPGFELMRRTRNREWVRQNAVLLGAGSDIIATATGKPNQLDMVTRGAIGAFVTFSFLTWTATASDASSIYAPFVNPALALPVLPTKPIGSPRCSICPSASPGA